MSKRVGVVLTTGAFVLLGIAGTAAAASAGEVPTSLSPSESPSSSAPASPTGSPSPTPPTDTSPSATPPTVIPSTSPGPSSPSAPAIITADEAKAIALAASGGGTITKFELKDEHSDHPEYRAEIKNGRVEHKIRIDALSGVITRHDIKS